MMTTTTHAFESPPAHASTRDRLALLARDIKLSHTIFALPWALLATFLAADGWPRAGQLVLIVLCMVAARTVAMASNRLLDAQLDARNPRTARRAIPSGQLSRAFVAGVLAACGFAFVGATSLFGFVYDNWLPLVLSVPVLLFLAAYPLLKRFTRLCHYYLGAALALAPVCAWIAVGGNSALSPFSVPVKMGTALNFSPLLMAAAVLLWTAGFDIIYACQDYRSDLKTGVVSVPARIGIGPALLVSRFTHALCVVMLVLLGVVSPQLDVLYFIGVGCAVALLVVEHALVKPDDLSKVGLAFFTVNGVISVVIGTLGIIDVFI